MKKKEIAFFAKRLGIGGIGRAIINYVNLIDKDKYDVTIFLEKMEGEYLKEVNQDIKIINFNLNDNKNVLLRKAINFFKLLKFYIKYYHKYDFSAHFATSIKSSAILSKYFSKNNAFWFHGIYWEDENGAKKFFNYVKPYKYKKLVFVSNYCKDYYCKYYHNNNQKLYVINNPINFEDILEKCEIKIHERKNKTMFLNVGRHEESSKKLTWMIRDVSRLIKEGYDFELWLVGEGIDTPKYKEMVKELKLEKYIKFLGFSSNVYPYYKMCDAVLLSSSTEGNPVVYLEAKTLHKPIISTDVSDAKEELDGFGIITKANENDFYLGMKEFLDHGYQIKKKFNPEKYNETILNKLYKMMEDEVS